MSNSQHTIAQQYLEVTFKDRREGMGLQNQLAVIYKEKILPLFESILSEHDLYDYTIQIDEITIDAGTLRSKNWEQELIERSVQQFKAILHKKLLSPWPRTQPAVAAGEKYIPLPPTEEGVQWTPHTVRCYDVWIHFLTTGSLAANGGPGSLEEIETVLLQNKQQWQTADHKETLLSLLLSSVQALERLFQQSSGTWVEMIMHWLNEEPLSAEPRYHQLYTMNSQARQIIMYTLALLKTARRKQPDANPHTFAMSISAPLQLLQQVRQQYQAAWIDQVVGELLYQQSTAPLEELMLPIAAATEKKDNKEETWHIHNAGLVLLHPFLSAFFTKLRLLDQQQQWTNKAAHQRAVLLTQYLVTGQSKIPEYLLPLNKLLCGYPQAATLSDKPEWTVEEDAEVQQLLLSVIEHWNVLKNTSVEALRTTFLQRAGRLTKQENGWRLLVEQETVDVLVQALPWTISRIKTPWMKEVLLVDWV